MMSVIFVFALVSYLIVLAVYALYAKLILKNSRTKKYVHMVNEALQNPVPLKNLPDVSILIPTYNEEASIARKLLNVAELEYPKEKLEIILVDDASTDKTIVAAETAFNEIGVRKKIVSNPKRRGVNASYNVGVPLASSDLVLRTDADILLERDALRKAVLLISVIDNLGGVTGRMTATTMKTTLTANVEMNYRDMFDQMSIAESALHSAFLGGGGFALLRKSTFSDIPLDRGSTDGNISFSIIRKGFRYIYAPCTFSHELISAQASGQIKQKVRRASRLLQSIIMNREMLFDKKLKEFGRVVFPLRFVMLIVCPFLFFAATFSALLQIALFSWILAIILTFTFGLIVYLGSRIKTAILSTLASFIVHQFYLLIGLFLLTKKMSTWKKGPA